MPISYTNRKGKTYFLCQGVTKTGKPRYYFSVSKEDVLEQIPAGYHIEESVNGIVSLAKDREQLILPAEEQVVRAALERHPISKNYRVSAKGKQITVYERISPDPDAIAAIFRPLLPATLRQQKLSDAVAILDQRARFSPMLRFNLIDSAARIFSAERLSYSFDPPVWIDIGDYEPMHKLANLIIPMLDTDDFYELL